MSVTIVSSPNANAAPAAPDSTAGDVASGDEFASVLQGQLALNAAQTPAAVPAPLALPSTAASSDDESDAATSGTDGTFDPSSLLATMAFVAPQTQADASGKVDGDSSSAQAVATGAGRGGALPMAADARTSVRGESAATPADASPVAAASNDTAAKFAVVAASADDTALAKKTAAETASAGGATTVGENVHAAAHLAGGKHPVHNESPLSVATPVRDREWAGDFSQKIVWLASSETQSAQLTLNPPQMGPIDISLSVEGGRASISFASANAEVRDAIETALPRLREMLASAGVELGQTNVGAESSRQQQQGHAGSSSASRSTADNAILAADSAAPLHSRSFVTQRGIGMVDLFA